MKLHLRINRHFWVLLHRYAGLYIAFILVVAGLTGSILAFDGEIMDWLEEQNSSQLAAVTSGCCKSTQHKPMLDPFTLRERALTLEPRARINLVHLDQTPGEMYSAPLDARTDPVTGQEYPISPVIINPHTGERLPNPPEAPEPPMAEQASDNPYWPITRQNFISVVLGLHYHLLLDEAGIWLFGIAASVWTFDCFVGFYLTLPKRRKTRSFLPQTQDDSDSSDLRPEDGQGMARLPKAMNEHPGLCQPNPGWGSYVAALILAPSLPVSQPSERIKSFWQRWQVAWKIKWPSSNQRLNFDLHRAGGLWAWPLLFIFAWSSVQLNLRTQVYDPVMNLFFETTAPTNIPPLVLATPRLEPVISFREAYQNGKRIATEQAQKNQFKILGERFLRYDPGTGLFQLYLITDRDLTGSMGLSVIFIDGNTGALVASTIAKKPTIGDTISEYLYYLHRKIIWGRPWQIVNFLMGLVTAMLSMTGVYLWWVKRRVAKINQMKSTQRDASPDSLALKHPPEESPFV